MLSKKLFNPPFLILKVKHPAVTKMLGVYCIVRDSRSGYSNDFNSLAQCERAELGGTRTGCYTTLSFS